MSADAERMERLIADEVLAHLAANRRSFALATDNGLAGSLEHCTIAPRPSKADLIRAAALAIVMIARHEVETA